MRLCGLISDHYAAATGRRHAAKAERFILGAAVSTVAGDMDRAEVVSWLKQNDLWQKASPGEAGFLASEHPTKKATIYFSWQMEAVCVLGWALKLIPKLDPPTEQASIGDILEQTRRAAEEKSDRNVGRHR